tara:strand:+ start:195 stop:386 length:192 start_codon:yes stop_codon:yes gene_type:complete
MSWERIIKKMSDTEKMNLIIRLLEGEIERYEEVNRENPSIAGGVVKRFREALRYAEEFKEKLA